MAAIEVIGHIIIEVVDIDDFRRDPEVRNQLDVHDDREILETVIGGLRVFCGTALVRTIGDGSRGTVVPTINSQCA